MIRDREMQLSVAQAVTADAASTDYLDLAVAARDIAAGEPLVAVFTIVEAFNNLTSVVFKLQGDDNTSFSSASDLFSVTQLLAALTLNARFAIVLNAGVITERYLRFYYDLTGTTPTTGKITAELLPLRDVPANVATVVA